MDEGGKIAVSNVGAITGNRAYDSSVAGTGDGGEGGAIRAVYGKDFSSKMIAVDGIADGVHVSGFIGRSDNNKTNVATKITTDDDGNAIWRTVSVYEFCEELGDREALCRFAPSQQHLLVKLQLCE